MLNQWCFTGIAKIEPALVQSLVLLGSGTIHCLQTNDYIFFVETTPKFTMIHSFILFSCHFFRNTIKLFLLLTLAGMYYIADIVNVN